jgi:hypothetical protein
MLPSRVVVFASPVRLGRMHPALAGTITFDSPIATSLANQPFSSAAGRIDEYQSPTLNTIALTTREPSRLSERRAPDGPSPSLAQGDASPFPRSRELPLTPRTKRISCASRSDWDRTDSDGNRWRSCTGVLAGGVR